MIQLPVQGRASNPMRLVKRLKITTHEGPLQDQANSRVGASQGISDSRVYEWDADRNTSMLPEAIALRSESWTL